MCVVNVYTLCAIQNVVVKVWPRMIMCNTKCCYSKDFILLWPTFTITNNQNHTNVVTSHSFNPKKKKKNKYNIKSKIPLPENSGVSCLPEVIQISFESGSCGFVEQSGIEFRWNARHSEWEEMCSYYMRITWFYGVQVCFITRH